MDGFITCEGVRVGGVPDGKALEQLAAQGVRTLVDAREEGEASGEDVAALAAGLGMTCLRMPISRRRVDVAQIERFRDCVQNPANAPVYAFSKGGKRPAGVLCFLACARMGDSVIEVFRRAKQYGLELERERGLKRFILDFYSSHRGDMLNNHFQKHFQHHPA
ncbi:hypothetical protein NNJEOMEG_02310 [Fundidesulfovibrio magnetotacticus]|uniref:DSP-PTPase phosphatase fused to NAD+ Kinase domain-containing protein n=1 Tax=Fundidesulfovibrio magnetotacticus TaxID=2730080 RepID=A0A6V8M1Y5_9BACT|nr:sulfur transferase domain-containing protein [Fundidesulfovibrio magnetotacticus]GFK94465.1 hypothetical protein NNJEOMEG_02310 [Fundidesulfovibrio magnetotacticus]